MYRKTFALKNLLNSPYWYVIHLEYRSLKALKNNVKRWHDFNAVAGTSVTPVEVNVK